MADIIVTVPDEVVEQVLPILQQLAEKVGGTIQAAPPADPMGGPGQPAYQAKMNRPSNLNPPAQAAPPAPMM